MNHSERFWRVVAEEIPEYQKAVRWLKKTRGLRNQEITVKETLQHGENIWNQKRNMEGGVAWLSQRLANKTLPMR